MLKKLQLTCLLSILFFGGIDEGLYAQTSADSTAVKTRSQEGIAVEGLIKDAKTGKGISGISIAVENFSAAITNEDGTFSIKVPHLNALLRISGLEYQAKVFPINNRENGFEIELFEANYSSFYEVARLPGNDQLQYTGTQATHVEDFDELQWSNPVNESVGDFLQGKVAGLNSVRKSGVQGSGAYLTLRGFNSLYATNKPLLVVDGLIYDDEDYGSGIIQNNTSSPLSMLDVKDIEDVTVLKDGSSLYGTKGANGVIIITTTRAVDLSTKIDFTMYGGFNQIPDRLPVLNSGEYRSYLSQLVATRGDSQTQIENLPWVSEDRSTGNYFRYRNNTNWQDQVFKNSGNQNYYLKIRGGDDIAKYGLSVGYLNSDGILKNSGLERYNTRLNASLKLTDKLFVDANLSFIHNTEYQSDQGLAYKTSPLYLSLTKSPFMAINAINASGEVSPNLDDVDLFNVSNPLAILDNGFGVNKNYRFFGNLNFKYQFNKNFSAHTIVGISYNKERESFFIPDFGVADLVLPTAIATNRSGSEVQRLYSILTDTYLNYSKQLDFKNKLDLRLGFRTQNNNSESDLGLGFNSATDDFTSVGAGSNLLRFVGGALGEWNWVNAYLSAEYDYLNKYFVTFNAALDGSSRFGDAIEDGGVTIGGSRFATMGSLSAGWLISSENFLKNIKAINLLKLRGSVGFTGNDDIGNYTAQQLYVSQNLLGLQGLVRDNIGNPELKWETVRKINLGADIALFNERLNASVDVYENKTTDMITYETISTTSGFDNIVSNSGTMQTRGIDLSLNSRLVNTSDIKFDLGFTLSRYINEVTDIPNEIILSQFGGATYITHEGEDANLFFGYQTNGVYATTAEATAAGLKIPLGNGNFAPFQGGDVIFTDLNGDQVIDEQDRTVIGNPNPDFTGSVSTSFAYKRLSLSALFNFSVGNDIYNGLRNNLEKMSGYENQSIAVRNRWVAEGQQTSIPRAVWGDPMGNASFSDRWIEDGSYLRLKTLVLAYDIPLDLDYLNAVKIYATANNLFTLTDYLGYDPEFSATSSIFGQGADIGLVPQFTTIQIGVRLGL
ncbi:SusC/RagA family TonB-linked outer membrane protein [Leeuwenhoekiella sp. W20_SRS_FM14]|uniref:SusC/RagA family TonB-linked outer membrane protein n=1 Tax=Leeuwenhoekiella sp. W20_SRS_FM14 TaxID=3240270 RepID=UPI003F9ABBC5